MSAVENVVIELTELETQLFDILKAVLAKYECKTTLRVAGGWVRDKVLGKQNEDIDITTDNVTGREFAEKVVEYYAETHAEQHRVAVIRADPEKSKHLECARIHILGIWVDFVNLRSEEYNEASRIPTVKFGTPLQDAERRDLTMNALFYNINTGMVEDFLHRGLDDLRAGLIRTPLEPTQTFRDDPLRMLRVARFASRFKFQIHDSIFESMKDSSLLPKLRDIVSQERITHEAQLMLEHPNCQLGINTLVSLGLHTAVIPLPDAWRGYEPRVERAFDGLAMLTTELSSLWTGSASELRLGVSLSAILHPVYGTTTLARMGKKMKETSAVTAVLRDIKMSNREISLVEDILARAAALAGLDMSRLTRGGVGAVLCGMTNDFKHGLIVPALALSRVTLSTQEYAGLLEFIISQHLCSAPGLRVPVNTKELVSLCGLVWGKPVFKVLPALQRRVLAEVFEARVDEASDREEAFRMMIERCGAELAQGLE
ncbi:tRNA nucleotidyltransferase [Carpediemonas membranifera]|uniref:tRNA nucleotidyltransferase n=1 Tax=Carpediemonas membranifera TaxID=201153 RepID=A0A8J6BA92_9EUKA|nr:tRNA nucleotidyltransferase [Carpediemonas membranifera]|eukprot:KAG9396524.1 tRNA nucleotidyltransferase [Carpediemonas membranifera]